MDEAKETSRTERKRQKGSVAEATRGGRRGWKARAEELERKVEELEKDVEENQDRYLRALADLDNFRKRAEREQAELIRNAGERLIMQMLEVLDGLDQALAVDPSANSAEGFLEGMRLLRQRLGGILEKEGLTEIESTGQAFDPNVHEAVMQVESGEHPSDTVVQELQKGYRLRERLLRPAKVTVAK